MDQLFDLEKALRILKIKGIGQGEVADRIGYSIGYISKVANGERELTRKFHKAFIDEFGDELEGAAIVSDPQKESILADLRIEGKLDAIALLLSAFMEDRGEEEKKNFIERISNETFTNNEVFLAYIDLAKKSAAARVKRSQGGQE